MDLTPIDRLLNWVEERGDEGRERKVGGDLMQNLNAGSDHRTLRNSAERSGQNRLLFARVAEPSCASLRLPWAPPDFPLVIDRAVRLLLLAPV
jgi:hypothetical protein